MKTSDRAYLFNGMIALSDTLCKTTRFLCEFIDSIEDRERIAKRISSYEDDGDDIFHDIRFYFGSNKLVDDPDAIRALDICIAIESIIDSIDELAKDFCRYNVTSIKENVVSSIINIDRAADQVMKIVVALNKEPNASECFKDSLELDHYKVEATKIYDINMNKLFSSETDPIEVIRWQAIYASVLKVFEVYEDTAEACGKYIYRWE